MDFVGLLCDKTRRIHQTVFLKMYALGPSLRFVRMPTSKIQCIRVSVVAVFNGFRVVLFINTTDDSVLVDR